MPGAYSGVSPRSRSTRSRTAAALAGRGPRRGAMLQRRWGRFTAASARSSPSARCVPHSLDLVIDFVNTRDVDEGTDSIERPQTLAAWLVERALLGPGETPTDGDHADAIRLREALRSLMLTNNGQPLDDRAGRGARARRSPRRARRPLRGCPGRVSRPGCRERRRRTSAAAGACRECPCGRYLAARQGMPGTGLRICVLRPIAQPLRRVVRYGNLRQPQEDPHLPRARTARRSKMKEQPFQAAGR